MLIIDHISTKPWDSNLKMPSILSMEFNIAITTENSNFAVIIGDVYKLNNFGIDSALALHAKFASVVNFKSRWVNSSS